MLIREQNNDSCDIHKICRTACVRLCRIMCRERLLYRNVLQLLSFNAQHDNMIPPAITTSIVVILLITNFWVLLNHNHWKFNEFWCSFDSRFPVQSTRFPLRFAIFLSTWQRKGNCVKATFVRTAGWTDPNHLSIHQQTGSELCPPIVKRRLASYISHTHAHTYTLT